MVEGALITCLSTLGHKERVVTVSNVLLHA